MPKGYLELLEIKGFDGACNNGSMNNPLRNFRIRLKSFLNGGSWSDPYELWPNMPSDFELVRRSRIRRSREGNVIPFPTKTKNEDPLISKIKKNRKESNGKNKLFITSHLWGEPVD